MKTLIRLFAVLSVFTLSIVATPKDTNAQISISFQVFYDQLSPYGNWINYPGYGYVWMPDAGPGFSPYATAGRWIFTEYGWTWVSDYRWGWAAFHYGRWMFDPYYGWLWVPDTVWGPAWVVWRSSPGYYGWAPLRPGISINVAFGPGYYVPNDWWVFTPCQHLSRHDVYNYYAPRSKNVTIINNTTIINRTYVDERERTTYSYGPDKDGVEKATGQAIKPVRISKRDSPGESIQYGQLSIYRPQVQKTLSNGGAPMPKIVTDIKEVKKRTVQGSASNNAAAPSSGKQSVPAKQLQAPPKESRPVNSNTKDGAPKQLQKEYDLPKKGSASVTGHANSQQLAGIQARQNAPSKIDKSRYSYATHDVKSKTLQKPMPPSPVKNNKVDITDLRQLQSTSKDNEAVAKNIRTISR